MLKVYSETLIRKLEEKTLEAGCTGYIEKPIAPETFVTEVEQFAKLRPAGEQTQ